MHEPIKMTKEKYGDQPNDSILLTIAKSEIQVAETQAVLNAGFGAGWNPTLSPYFVRWCTSEQVNKICEEISQSLSRDLNRKVEIVHKT